MQDFLLDSVINWACCWESQARAEACSLSSWAITSERSLWTCSAISWTMTDLYLAFITLSWPKHVRQGVMWSLILLLYCTGFKGPWPLGVVQPCNSHSASRLSRLCCPNHWKHAGETLGVREEEKLVAGCSSQASSSCCTVSPSTVPHYVVL